MKPNAEKVVVERRYRASLQDVWDLWTTKEGFESWWGPVGFRADVAELDARVGGKLRYDMVAATPEMVAEMQKVGRGGSHPVTAHFVELVPTRRLVIENVIDFLPGVTAYKSNITVDLFDEQGSVRMVVTLDGMHNPEFTEMQKQGFTSQLTKLDKRFA